MVNLVTLVKTAAAASPDLVKPRFRKAAGHPLAGHCYIACEALSHLEPGKYHPQVINYEGVSHWFLRTAQGEVVDPTAEQFSTPVPYDQGRGCGFLTRVPSARTRTLLRRMKCKKS